jgi:RHS repeat-associated protein
VNGGGEVVLQVKATNYFTMQRHVQTVWHNYAVLDDLYMTGKDTTANSPVTLGSSGYQRISGSTITNSGDTNGATTSTRTARVLFPPSTSASFTFGSCGAGGTCPTGQTCNSTTNLCTGSAAPYLPPAALTVRATEYTVGSTGPASMPADLPAFSAYTYAVELSADEATSAGATGIAFTNPVMFYVENFIGFPSASEVPAGYYDVNGGKWVPMPDGKVIGITSIQSTCSPGPSPCAVLDTASAALGIVSAAELNQLAILYPSVPSGGLSLWRFTTPHFSTVDLNWPMISPVAITSPPAGTPSPTPAPPVPNPDCGHGSILECDNQILAQQLPIAGTPFSLRYQSDRAPGRTPGITIPLTGNTLSSPVPGIIVRIVVAGRLFTFNYPALSIVPNQNMTFAWDGLDAYGNIVQGMQTAAIDVEYMYPIQYTTMICYEICQYFTIPGSGYLPPGATRTAQGIAFDFASTVELQGVEDAQTLGLGGWTLNVNHVYDPSARVVWGGDGSRRTLEAATSVIHTVADSTSTCGTSSGDGSSALGASFQSPVRAMAALPDGSYYVTDYLSVRYVNGLGNISHYAGNYTNSGPCTGTCPAISSWVNPTALAVGPDSAVYIGSNTPSSTGNIQRVDPISGNIATIAGSGSGCIDGVLGTGALSAPSALAVAPDGSVLFIDSSCQTLRRVGADGTLLTLTATSCSGGDGDGGPVGKACLNTPIAVATAANGTIYVSDSNSSGNQRVRRIDPHTGVINTIAGGAGSGTSPPTGDGLVATLARFGLIKALSVGSDGTLYVSDNQSSALWSVDVTGIAHVIAGGLPGMPPTMTGDDGGPAQRGYVPQPYGASTGPNGAVYIADYDCRIRAITPSFPGYMSGGSSGSVNTYIPSEDGSQVFGFDPAGRHMATYDGTTGLTLLTFAYASDTHQLVSVTDANGNLTSISHASGSTTITPPFGQPSSQQTVLTLATSGPSIGYATSLKNPNSETTTCTYQNGLMQSFQTPAGNLHQFTYDSVGDLLSDKDPTGATQYLYRTLQNSTGLQQGMSWTSAVVSGASHTTTHAVTNATTGTLTQTETFPSQAMGTRSRSTVDIYTQTLPDGTTSSATMGPDPRFGMLDPYPVATSVTTPPVGSQPALTEATTLSLTSTGGTALMPAAMSATVTVNTSTSTMAYTQGAPCPTATPSTRLFTSATSRQLKQQIDCQGRVTQVSYPTSTTLVPTTFTYETTSPGGRLLSVSATSGTQTRTTNLTYTGSALAGYLASITDPMSYTTTFDSRDGVGRTLDVELADYSTKPKSKYSMTYDPDGNLNSLTVPPATSYSSAHDFTSNSLDLLGVYAPPGGGLGATNLDTTYTYDPDRHILGVSIPHASGYDYLSYVYDGYGRVSKVLDGLSGVSRTYAYNSADQVSSVTTSDGDTLTNTYAGFLTTSASWSGGTGGGTISGSVGWTFDNFFRVVQRTINGGNTVAYTYDADSLFASTTSPAAFGVTRDYTNLYGRITGSGLGSVNDTWTYNGFGELATYTATTNSGATTLYSMTGVTRNKNGQITAMTESVNGVTHTWGFTYGMLRRLGSATRDSTTNTYTYDVNGNRLTLNTAPSTYDVQDRLGTAPNSVSFAYTRDGTILSQTDSLGTRTFGYDLTGGLRSVVLENGHSVTYALDGLGRRIGRSLIWGSTTISQQFLYDGRRIVAELNGSTVTSVFVYGTKANVPDYMVRGGKAYRIVSDQLGSVRLVVDTSTNPATVIQQLDYDEFGNVLSSSNDTTCAASAQCFPFQPFGFAGGIQDRDTGLVRFGARDYQPFTGRWVSKDPIRLRGGLNVYVYAANDPVDVFDLTGSRPVIDSYGTKADAAYAALSDLFDRENADALNQYEWGGAIYANGDGSYSYTDPVTQLNPDSVEFAVDTSSLVGAYHNHPDIPPKITPNGSLEIHMPDVFSPTDIKTYEMLNSIHPGFVGFMASNRSASFNAFVCGLGAVYGSSGDMQ